MSGYDDIRAEYARIDAAFEAALTADSRARLPYSSRGYLDALGVRAYPSGYAVWENRELAGVGSATDPRGRVEVSLVPPPVQCPRCSGSGEERLFMHADTCEVCAGDGSVSPETAKAETARREEEIERWK